MVDSRTEAIERVYRERFVGFRNALATVTGDYDTARDAVQEGFARAFASRDQYCGEAPLAAWVWRIAFRVALGMKPDPLAATLPAGCEPGVVWEDRDPVLAAAVRALPARRRLVVFLRYYADLSYPEIAAALDISEGTVGATLSQAHDLLRQALTPQDDHEASQPSRGRHRNG
jgi:RNA polymerase sigma-70 factor, ECF subfamily